MGCFPYLLLLSSWERGAGVPSRVGTAYHLRLSKSGKFTNREFLKSTVDGGHCLPYEDENLKFQRAGAWWAVPTLGEKNHD